MIDGILIGVLLSHVVGLIVAIFILYGQTHQGWIALDCWLHCLFYEDAMAGETFSARCWRRYTYADRISDIDKWYRRVKWIDRLFGEGHCRRAFEAEKRHDYLPKEEK